VGLIGTVCEGLANRGTDAGDRAGGEVGEAVEEVCRAAGVLALLLAEGDGAFGVADGDFVGVDRVALEHDVEGVDGAGEVRLCREADAQGGGELDIGDVEECLGGGEVDGEGIEGDAEVLGDLAQGEVGAGECLDEAGEVDFGGLVGGDGHGARVRRVVGIVNRYLYGYLQIMT